MEIVDSRRLTGLNVHDDAPGAIAEIVFAPGEDIDAALDRWRGRIVAGLERLGWTERIRVARTGGAGSPPGASLFVTAPIDRLYAATELVEWAVAGANGIGGDLTPILAQAASERAARRGLLELVAQAEARGVPWLADDAIFSLGWGCRSRSFPVDALPDARAIDWSTLSRIPVALVTGTNGKTTTSRLLARMAHEAGRCAGNTTTDGICVDERIVEVGDWTGPGAARALLRRTEVELAVLETARGGLLRRGLEVREADAAIVTNVERDHLGEHGIGDLADMARVKGLVARVVRPDGRVVLGADSPAIVDWSRTAALRAPVEWFSLDPGHPVLEAHRDRGGTVWTIVDGVFVQRGDHDVAFGSVDEAPITFGGRARHNSANVLAALAVGSALGLAGAAMRRAIEGFGAAASDNPGRGRVWRLPGQQDLLVDFAHNLGGIEAMADFVGTLGRRVVLSFGMAGDRSDEDLRALGRALTRFRPRAVILREQDEYRRGREPGVVPARLAEGLREAGYDATAIETTGDERESLVRAHAVARPGELLVLLVHCQREAVRAWLAEVGAQPTSLA
jgi:UDP-N-acetylmuramyl tripeptide synthase